MPFAAICLVGSEERGHLVLRELVCAGGWSLGDYIDAKQKRNHVPYSSAVCLVTWCNENFFVPEGGRGAYISTPRMK